METTSERCYYVYRHLRGDNGRPFYIGRGKHTKNACSDSKLYSRANDKGKRNRFWKNVFNKYGREVEIMLDNLTYEESIQKEIELIALYGRAKNTSDGLCNLTDGGEGSVNFKHSPESIALFKQRATPLVEKISNSVKIEANGCWSWTATVSDNRPIIWVNNSGKHAKRVVYSHFNKISVPRNHHVYNTCKNPLCVNPDHLVLEIAAKSIRDKSILIESDVIEIKKLAYSGVTHSNLAKRYNVRRNVITKIMNGTNWEWVKVEGIPDSVKGLYHKNVKKPVMCIDTGEVFPSAKEASVAIFKTDKHFRYIRKVCSVGKYTYCQGFNFKFAE